MIIGPMKLIIFFIKLLKSRFKLIYIDFTWERELLIVGLFAIVLSN